MVVESEQLEKCHCNGCGRQTLHELIASRTVEYGNEAPDGEPFPEIDTYEMLQCRGCESVTLRHTNLWEPTGETTVSYYPPQVSRRSPTWRWKLPKEIAQLLEQVYTALHADSLQLALMGVRAVIDLLVLDRIGDVGSFKEKISALEVRGFIGSKQGMILGAALEAGHAATHRGYNANREDLEAVMDIVENLLQVTYPLSEVAEELRAKTPPRPPRVKRT